MNNYTFGPKNVFHGYAFGFLGAQGPFFETKTQFIDYQ